MISRGFDRGFRCLNCTLKSLAPVQQRTFTSSPARLRHGAVPLFSPTSSPELDELFSAFRNTVFLPSHLSKPHKDLIFKGKLQHVADTEPVYATIAGEKFQLHHVDRTKDVPGRSQIRKAARWMRERKDWDNLPSLLIGLKDAKRMVDSGDLPLLARKAGLAGRLDVILECARRVTDTGFRLTSPGLLAEIMVQLQDKAVTSGWAPGDTNQALSWAENFYELLDDKRHAGGRIFDAEEDTRARPEVVGILIQLSAVSTMLFYGGEDRDGTVAKYTARLLGSPATRALDFDLEYRRDNMAKVDLSRNADHDVFASNKYLFQMAPVLHGVKLAAQILGPVDGLSELASKLEASVVAQRESLLNTEYVKMRGRIRGLESYDRLFGPDAKQIVPVATRSSTQAETITTEAVE